LKVESSYACLACPGVDPAARRALAAQLLVEDAQIRTRSFLSAHADALRASRGLADFLATWAESPTASHADARGFPIALSVFRSPQVDPLWAAVASAVHLSARGHQGQWRATLSGARSFIVGEVLALGARNLHCDPEGLHLVGDDGREVRREPIERVELGARGIVVLGRSNRSFLPSPLEEMGIADTLEPIERVRSTLDEALLMIRSHAPAYLAWIEDAVDAIIPVLPPAGGYGSGSEAGLHGIIHASFPIRPLGLAESLVHEASHQYFHIAELDTLMSNGQDTRLYLNPYTHKERPIGRILLAFHAFANVALLYRACLEGGVLEAKKELEVHLESGEGFDAALRGSDGLTPSGRVLYQAIRGALFA
jgi:hypothetical protein